MNQKTDLFKIGSLVMLGAGCVNAVYALIRIIVSAVDSSNPINALGGLISQYATGYAGLDYNFKPVITGLLIFALILLLAAAAGQIFVGYTAYKMPGNPVKMKQCLALCMVIAGLCLLCIILGLISRIGFRIFWFPFFFGIAVTGGFFWLLLQKMQSTY